MATAPVDRTDQCDMVSPKKFREQISQESTSGQAKTTGAPPHPRRGHVGAS